MIPSRSLTITYRDGRTEKIQVVEVGYKTYVASITSSWVETELAEAAIRRSSAAGLFDLRVPMNFLDQLADDSADEVIRAAQELNNTPDRSKKALALIRDSLERMSGPATPSAPSAASPSS